MKTTAEIFFPHEEALREIFADHKGISVQESLQLIVANQHRLTRDQQEILREGLAALESSRHNAVPHEERLPMALVTAEERGKLLDDALAKALLADLAQPYARDGKDRVLGVDEGGPEAERYAQSYIPLTMDARDYLWGDEDMALINQMRKERLAKLGDEEIARIMNEHKEMIAVLYENPDVAQYFPGVPATPERKETHPLEKALENIDKWHKQLWSEIHELRRKKHDARPDGAKEEAELRLSSDARLSNLSEMLQSMVLVRNVGDQIRRNSPERVVFKWTHFSKGLTKELARPAGLRVSFAADDLATKFGEPPTEMFVEELWPVLRDRWLATRPASRNRVVSELRKSGLGDTAIKVTTKTGQMEYLRSCRRSGRLKAIVLAAFLDEGSQPMMAASVVAESHSDSQPPEPAAKDTQGVPEQVLSHVTPPDQTVLAQPGVVRSRVTAIMTALSGSPPSYDSDGDIAIGAGSARLFLRIIENDVPLPMIRVFGQIVRGVRSTPEVLGDLNEANQRTLLCRLLHVQDTIVVDGYIPAASLTDHELSFLIDEALRASDHLDTLLARRHGGSTLGTDRGEVVDV